MSKRSIKKWALLLTFWLALHTSALHATTILAGTSPAIIEMDTNGLLDDIGTYGTGTLSLSGAGTRMFWYPGKAAFRAGYVSGTQWDDANIGAYSVAFGYSTKASGADSVAMGYSSIASGSWSTAMGGGVASGSSSVALGTNTYAYGADSTAMGYFSTANGSYSTSMGGSTANGTYSTAMGSSIASGNYSTTAGRGVTAGAFQACAVGGYNVNRNADGTSTPNATTWVATDPLFEVGNGYYLNVFPYTTTYSDALVVYKNGNTTVNGNLTVNGSISSTLTSLALLPSASATGTDAVALGYSTLASGNYGFANGSNTTASGTYAAAAGYHTTAASYDSFVVGIYNTGGTSPSSTTWVSTDPLFEVGNGTDSSHKSDALSVDKSGNTTVQGTVTAPTFVTTTAAGDIPMFTGY